ncbi:MAG: aminopeptidase N [Cellvibrionales bacterium]|mgnify:CR=1 FL=1|jgi:aminopeptidase N|nr:aminopeptidase N [Cellvibrionales bacterium]
MSNSVTQATLLQDYKPSDFLIDETHLNFQLTEMATTVNARLKMRRNPQGNADALLVLDGAELATRSVTLNGKPLPASDYEIKDNKLHILAVLPESFELETIVAIRPQLNTALEGLYKSSGMFCTQCEAEGFRRITWYLDRPDVMSLFTVTILAEEQRYPVLLSNGNLVESGKLNNGMHWATWKDPFKKPCYLFALVAGNLKFVEDYFVTRSGRRITLRIYVEAKDLAKCSHAMSSLKRAMAWDEKVYGREYDLDIYMIVAVDDFNMGAMENKGLNIFNTSCVLARAEVTTDKGFQRVEAVVAHEYFHNWSGNRVTCRDWFQLSLKEGFTVFRDSEFSADMGSRTVKRIEEVNMLRTAQFAEDAGPMAHPVQPASYMEISNFYTATVYEKGAEVVRMLHRMLGAENFRKGTDLFFARHDGQAVTIDEFLAAMSSASHRDLTQFRYWYTQAGTPVLRVRSEYNAREKTLRLSVEQSCPATPEASYKEPFHIPVVVGLLGKTGGELSVRLRAERMGEPSSAAQKEHLLEVRDSVQQFVFEGVEEQPVLSLLRGFSAPVKLDYPHTADELAFLMSHDSDGFNRWDAAQQLGVQVLQKLIDKVLRQQPLDLDNKLVAAFRVLLLDETLDPAMVALMLELPSESYLAELSEVAHPVAIHRARQFARKALAHELRHALENVYHRHQPATVYQPVATAIAHRSLKNIVLSYLALLNDKPAAQLCLDQYNNAANMTDASASLQALINCDADFVVAVREKALRIFYRRWQQEPLAVNLWLQWQAACSLPGALDRVKELLQHEAFDIRNPNKVRAVIGAFCSQNLAHFHADDGSGYRFLADKVIELDAINPQIAARLLSPLTRWQKMPAANQEKMRTELQRILDSGKRSPDVYEVASKSVLKGE